VRFNSLSVVVQVGSGKREWLPTSGRNGQCRFDPQGEKWVGKEYQSEIEVIEAVLPRVYRCRADDDRDAAYQHAVELQEVCEPSMNFL
jgi:hypothetical protein